MIRNYYRELFAADPVNLIRAERLARNVCEFTEYIDSKSQDPRFSELSATAKSQSKVAFHESCHAKRELGVEVQPKAILDKIADRVELPQA